MSISTSTEYDFKSIEPKWQRAWDERSAFTPGDNDTRPKYYALSMFPYPSGALHVGHMRNYTLVDVVTRYRMAKGYAVINPMGWDAFGLPAENAAIERGVHPAKWTYKNIEHMRGQFKRVGFGFDWSREVFTCREDYYKWTQWIFLQMLKHKGKSGEPVAYRKTGKVNWCPKDQTVLANEQVVKIERQGQTYDGCFRCGTKVVQKEMAQWALRITD
ncbi:MAG: class I tRNA ligase family protein, partial [Planctomycetes bacterium]|nr:class I tRNA ligase family protein [Planctomycetota bacterium]